jgi:putative ABC transport system permease protein
MRSSDTLRLSLHSLTTRRMQSFLTLLGIAVGITAVILLTSIGEGVHRFVLNEFTQFGTHIITITPGKTRTGGATHGLPSSARLLTLDDANALSRLPGVIAVAPYTGGNAEIEGHGRIRRSMVWGTNEQTLRVFKGRISSGSFLPAHSGQPRALAVLGSKLKYELFANSNPIGARIRVGGHLYRVIGVMAPQGQFLGMDLDDSLFIPTERALELFNRDGLEEIDLAHAPNTPSARVAQAVRQRLIDRHGHEDFTLVTQAEMLSTLSNILNMLTLGIGALGGISLLVGGVGIVTIMTIAVTERTAEIGLMKALGATQRGILSLFLFEAMMLAAVGGLLGLGLGIALAQGLHLILPTLPVHTPLPFILLAEATALGIGLIAGILPALRAARLDPVSALRSE